MRTYQHDCDVLYQSRQADNAAWRDQKLSLSYIENHALVEFWLPADVPPWQIDRNLLYRLAYRRCNADDTELHLRYVPTGDMLEIHDDEHGIMMALSQLRGFLTVTYGEAPLTARHPVQAAITLPGDDIERVQPACLAYSSEEPYDVVLELSTEFGHHPMNRSSLREGLADEIQDDTLAVGPARYERLPVVVQNDHGLPDFTVELEVADITEFLAETQRLVPPDQEYHYMPGRFDREVADILASGGQPQAGDSASPETEPQP